MSRLRISYVISEIPAYIWTNRTCSGQMPRRRRGAWPEPEFSSYMSIRRTPFSRFLYNLKTSREYRYMGKSTLGEHCLLLHRPIFPKWRHILSQKRASICEKNGIFSSLVKFHTSAWIRSCCSTKRRRARAQIIRAAAERNNLRSPWCNI